jgi:uncharacterized protein (TIGR01777 family)
MDKKRILIAGGTGFIGRALARALAESGREIIILTRDPGKSAGLFSPGIASTKWDGRTARGWEHFADGAFAIVNLAGDSLAQGRWTRRKKTRILRSRVDSGGAVVAAVRAVAHKPEVVVQASAVGAYGSRGDEELDELSPPGGGFLADVVRAWEDSTKEVEDLGLRRIIIRSGLVMGAGGGVLPRLAAPFRFFAGGPLGNGRQWFSWIHLADEILAMCFLLERPELAGIFNLTAPNPLREKDLCRALGAAMKRACWLPVPGPALKLLFGEKARETLLAGQKAFPRRLLEAGFVFSHPEAGAALADLVGK